jgi:hypothetical protein
VIASCGAIYGGDEDPELPSREDARAEAASDGQGLPTDSASGVDAKASVDASTPPCDLAKPFATPVAIAELNTTDIDIVSSVSPDELTIYVGTTHKVAQGFQQFYATRATKTATWGALQASFPAGAWDNWGVTVTPDGLTAVVSSDRNGNNSELYVATRASTLAAFGPLGLIAGSVNSTANEEGAHWSADGKTLYFDSTRGSSRDLYSATVVGSAFGAPAALTTLNSGALDAVPVIGADELTIYFLSTRAPTTDGDIYVATRATKAAPFGNVQVVPNVNSAFSDAPAHVSADGCTLYLTSGRSGNSDIFVAKRPN